jgi:hypothetical protein
MLLYKTKVVVYLEHLFYLLPSPVWVTGLLSASCRLLHNVSKLCQL